MSKPVGKVTLSNERLKHASDEKLTIINNIKS